jgi:hypothetical protein
LVTEPSHDGDDPFAKVSVSEVRGRVASIMLRFATSSLVGCPLMTRHDVLVAVIVGELTRLGRPAARVTLSADNRIAISDVDGAWEGSATRGLSRLMTCDRASAVERSFWTRFDD